MTGAGKVLAALAFLFAMSLQAWPQENCARVILEWNAPVKMVLDSDTLLMPSFTKARYSSAHECPAWKSWLEQAPRGQNGIVNIIDPTFADLTPAETLSVLSFRDNIPDTLSFSSRNATAGKEERIYLEVIPFVREKSGKVIKLTEFSVSVIPNLKGESKSAASKSYADHSVLASGNWYKLAAPLAGIYKITYDDLKSYGINPDNIDPRNLAIFGNGGSMLPEKNSDPGYDDLVQNAIEVAGESDGRFDAGDYLLFYGTGTTEWKYNAGQSVWEHVSHLYADTAVYFLTLLPSPAIRTGMADVPPGQADEVITAYDFRDFHENDELNLIKSGRQWFGEVFDISLTRDFDFGIPGLRAGDQLFVKISTAARSTQSSAFTFTSGDETWGSVHYPISVYFNSPYASSAVVYRKFAASSNSLKIHAAYSKPTLTAIGWMDYIDVTARCSLSFAGRQLPFRDALSKGDGKIVSYNLSGATSGTRIWDLTDPLQVKRVETQVSGSTLTFKAGADTIREYVAHDGSDYYKPAFAGRVPNQDLHALQNVDYIIVAPPVFLEQATRLANYHVVKDDLSTVVVSPEAIYNEFSSGMQDPVSIRSFVKMLYDRSVSGNSPKCLLLFGDGSYDNKNRVDGNTNFIPTFQSLESFDPVRSVVSDDYFGLLDDNEGTSPNDPVDIGIGRLPVKTVKEAEQAVDKIISYGSSDGTVVGDWRNFITFVADDEDDNEHIIQSEVMAGIIRQDYRNYNIEKIYLDAFPQVSTPSGARYPDVNKAINQRVDNGSLIINYTGHGGETGWAHEQVLQVQDINSWTNYGKWPVFVTATCEFSRFDDPGRTSAGEMVLLNAFGGGIALFTTTRATYGSPNFELNKSFYSHALQDGQVTTHRLGDIIMKAKQEEGSDDNGRKFILLGDPALSLSAPELSVETTSINGRQAGSGPDTLQALSKVTIEGMVTDRSGTRQTGFNGVVIPSVYDKATSFQTLGNDGGSSYPFLLQKNLLYKGAVDVTNGLFSFTFIVPRDIAYRYDFGKISYYAYSDEMDAAGSYEQVVIGGASGEGITDHEGPGIELYMNDTLFTNGSITNENPWLLAFVEDESGINTIGNGIGHDITAVLDGETDNPYILNEFYESDPNTYKSGSILFPFHLLDAGEHELTFKVWDVLNNSSEATIRFTVYASGRLVITNTRNFPNPFAGNTSVVFDHNQRGAELKVVVRIYSLLGNLVRELEQTGYQEGTASTPLVWDGTDREGQRVAPGIYAYTVVVSGSGVSYVTQSAKMINLK